MWGWPPCLSEYVAGPPSTSEERGHVARMVSAHVCENRGEQGVVLDVLVEPRGQTVQRIDATEPLVKAWNALIGHDEGRIAV